MLLNEGMLGSLGALEPLRTILNVGRPKGGQSLTGKSRTLDLIRFYKL